MERISSKPPVLDVYPSGTARFTAAVPKHFNIEKGDKVSFFAQDDDIFIKIEEGGDYTVSEDSGSALRFNPRPVAEKIWGKDRDETLKFKMDKITSGVFKLTPAQ